MGIEQFSENNQKLVICFWSHNMKNTISVSFDSWWVEEFIGHNVLVLLWEN